MSGILLFNIFLFLFILFFWMMRLYSKKKDDGEGVYFYLDENDEGHIKRFPKGSGVDGVKLTDEDLRTLRETGKLDISDRKNFQSKKGGKKSPRE